MIVCFDNTLMDLQGLTFDGFRKCAKSGSEIKNIYIERTESIISFDNCKVENGFISNLFIG